MSAAVCLASHDLVDLLDGTLGARTEEIHDHLASCPSCAELVSTLMGQPGQAGEVGSEASRRSPPLAPGERIGDLVIERVLGAGSFGVVYRARDVLVDRDVALKVLDGAPQQPDERYLAELRHLGRVTHPHVATVFGAERTAAGRAAIVMELVEGRSLGAVSTTLPDWRAVLALFLQVAEGLAAIHEAGVVHGDFKPDNVLVDASGRAVVVDFGLSLAVDENSPEGRASPAAGGTPAYLAPEALTGRALDPRADQYAYCVALVEALGGARPRPDDKGRKTLALGRAPAALEGVLRRGLDPDAGGRWPSMRDLQRALRAQVAVVDGVRVNAAFAAGGCLLAAGALLGGHAIGPRPELLAPLLLGALLLGGLSTFGQRSRWLAWFCRAAGTPTLLAIILGLVPCAALLVGPGAAFSSFVIAQLLAVAIVLPAFSSRGHVSVILGLVAAAVYLGMRSALGESAATSWTNVLLRAALMVFTGLLAWMLSQRSRSHERSAG